MWLFALAAPVQSPDPFLPGPRWHLAPEAGEEWIPRSLALVGDDWIWTAGSGHDPCLCLIACDGSSSATRARFVDRSDLAGALGPILVAAGDRPNALYALAQFPGPTPSSRRTTVRRYDAISAARGTPFVPLWTHELARRANGPALFSASRDGSALAAAVFDPLLGSVELELLDPVDGHPTASETLAGTGLKRLIHSDDGARLLLGAGTRVWCLAQDGEVVWSQELGATTTALALSGDGRHILQGELSSLSLWTDTGGTFERAGRWSGTAHELAVEAAIARDGQAVCVAWWNPVDGASVRLEFIEPESGARQDAFTQVGAATHLQNFPSALRLSADGSRAALGLWGAGDERPEGLLFERGRKEPRLAVDVPGSVETVALDASGTRLVLATRERHANLFSQSGGLELHDTGERDLVLRSEVRAGGELDAVYRLADQGRTVFFVAGFPLASPEDLWGGESWLDRRRRLVFFRGVRETPERVAGRLLIPARHELIGRSLGLQAATFGPEGARLAGAHLRFLVL